MMILCLRLLLLLSLCCAPGLSPAQPGPALDRIESPRNIGWMIGDVLTQRIILHSPAQLPLQLASLPQPGPLNYWLELRDVQWSQQRRDGALHYQLTLSYQSFYVPLDVSERQLPAFSLRFGENGDHPLDIPRWSFTMSPLRPVTLSSSSGLPMLQADAPLQLPDSRPAVHEAGMALVASLALTLLLLRHYGAWPFHQRRQRPFAQAHRRIRQYRKAADPAAYALALRAMHQALQDSYQQRTVLFEDLPDFLASHPHFVPAAASLTDFFHASHQYFFASMDDETAIPTPAWQALQQLSRAMARAERTAKP